MNKKLENFGNILGVIAAIAIVLTVTGSLWWVHNHWIVEPKHMIILGVMLVIGIISWKKASSLKENTPNYEESITIRSIKNAFLGLLAIVPIVFVGFCFWCGTLLLITVQDFLNGVWVYLAGVAITVLGAVTIWVLFLTIIAVLVSFTSAMDAIKWGLWKKP